MQLHLKEFLPEKMTEQKYCPICEKESEVEFVSKPDVDLKVCKVCGSAVAIRYKDT